MTFEIPAWEPFDPSSDGLPESLQELLPGRSRDGAIVVSAVAPATEDSDWPALASVRLAEALGASGGRALLIDLGLEHPTLDKALGTSPGEGISDVLLFSASVQHVAHAVREGSFLFAPAGTVVGDPSAVLAHEGWDALLSQYVDGGTTVVLHVPSAADGAETVMAKADVVVVMSGPSDPPPTLAEGFSGAVAWVGPPLNDTGPGTLGAEADPVFGGSGTDVPDDEAFSAPGIGNELERRSLLEAEFEGLPTVSDAPAKRPRSRVLLWIAAVLILAAVVVMFMVRGSSGPVVEAVGGEPVTVSSSRIADPAPTPPLAPIDAEVEALPESEGNPSTEVPGTSTTDVASPEALPPASASDLESPVLAYGLTINAHQQISAAEAQAASLADRFADLQFILVPVDVRGTLYYRVVAGPARSAADAERIRTTIRGYVGAIVADRAIVRSTRWAYLLGSYPDRGQAAVRVAQATDRGVPAYLVEVRPDETGVAYRVYSGGFASQNEAAALGRLVEGADLLPAPLVERIGRPTQ